MSEVIIPQKIGRRLQCNCGYLWVYCGKGEFFASCPRCRSTVTIHPKKRRLENKNKSGGAAESD
jgi:hypothetical protein